MFSSNTTQVSGGAYEISRSLRFNSADSAYLNRTFSAGNRKTWTWSAWIKRCNFNTGNQNLFQTYGSQGGDNDYFSLRFIGDTLGVVLYSYFPLISTQVFRDPSAWYHVVCSLDTTQATASNRLKIYINGSEITAWSTDNRASISQNADLGINAAYQHNIGAYTGAIEMYPGYMTEVNFVNGQALTPSSFGETNAQTGVWGPKAYSGSYGTNGFYLNFSDNSNTTAATLGKDYSGNGNNWTPNNFSVTAGAGNDSMVDVPTPYGVDTGAGGTVRGNYATLNPIGGGSGTITNGNLDLSTSNNIPAVGAFAMTTGKWYWEIRNNSVANPRIGVYNIGAANPADLGGTANGWCLLNSPSRTYNNGSAPAYGSYSPTTGTIVMVAYDADAGKLWFGQDGTWFASGNPATGANASMTSVIGSAIVPALANGAGTDTFSANFGQRPFAYTAPSGFKALCTQNLPVPSIGATSATTADKFFAPVTFTSSGTGSITISSLGFQPDFTWWKSRATVVDHYLMDVLRGNSTYLASNRTLADQTYSNIWTPSSSGWTSSNGSFYNNDSNVAWNWKANGSGSTNTAGSITSTVSANTTSGFSVVTYSGNSTSGATVGHGLGVAPVFVIVKSRNDTFDWIVWSKSFATNSTTAFLNTTDAAGAYGVWSSTLPSSTVITLPSSSYVNGSTKTYVAYCFAEVAGYSKFGSFVGNGSADGAFVFTGMRPAFVMLKASSTGGAGYNWGIFDNDRLGYNSAQRDLRANTTDTEGTDNNLIDFLSNGFKIRSTSGGFGGGSGVTYIYMAFAENPFKYSLAR